MKKTILTLVLFCSACGSQDVGGYCATYQGQVAGQTAAINHGEPTIDRLATVALGGCTGVVIGPHTVLSAAHCEHDNMAVRVDTSLPSYGEYYPVSSYRVHPEWSGSYPYYDLMVVEVEGTLPPPYVTPYFPEMQETCNEFLAQGYGANPQDPLTYTLRQQAYTVTGVDPLVLWTASSGPGAVCRGDSGGPLYAVIDGEIFLAGIVSAGYTGDACDGKTAHVRVDAFLDFIYGDSDA